MQKWTIRLLLISISFFLFSCKTYQVSGEKLEISNSKVILNPYFSNENLDYVYKTHIEVYGNDLSGIFVTKKINDSIHRVVFTTDFGNKLLDFEISNNSFKVNYVVEDLDRKLILNTLEKDFKLLLKQSFVVDEMFENEEYYIYKSNAGKRFNYIYQSKTDDQFIKIIQTSKRKEKLRLNFDSKEGKIAENILILHQNIKLTISLNKFEN
ncbi:hypothetical protein [Flavobacterium sp. N2270]|uniref:hypothetical protein n=1 Tax=Flavobacterium sp. N2270 TaxID=2986831 RepID=UPI00222555B1|nr:hypothetical protein [Flavobacterium sp. N2270]